jgi:hypothetical protein
MLFNLGILLQTKSIGCILTLTMGKSIIDRFMVIVSVSVKQFKKGDPNMAICFQKEVKTKKNPRIAI